ncbi:MAG TPA: ABC transporter permease [Planctomycetota bacterium]|nr:ABC transporter permease [Planctomycetota bacterium]
MDPLSPWTYARRNLRKLLPTLVILTFVVLLVVLVLTLLAGLKDSTLVYAREYEQWSILLPKKDTRLPKAVLERIAAHPAVDRLIDSRNCFMRVKTLVGPVPYHLRAAKAEEMPLLLERARAALKEGRMPTPGTGEVALHENLMKANGWSLGAAFGMAVSEDDWMPGRFTVVGILQGPTPMGLASAEYLTSGALYAFSAKLWERVIAVSKPGRLAEMNAFLREVEEIKVYDHARAIKEISESFDRILLILNFVSVVIIGVVALVVGMLHTIFFAQRIDEFAVLLAIGHTRTRLLRKVSGETAGLMAVSWAGGLVLAFAGLAAFRALVLDPMGVQIPLVQATPLLVAASLPVVAHLFATVTVRGRLRRLDPVTIIERRG